VPLKLLTLFEIMRPAFPNCAATLSTLLMAAGNLVEELRGKQVTELPSSPDGSMQTSRGLAKFPAGGFPASLSHSSLLRKIAQFRALADKIRGFSTERHWRLAACTLNKGVVLSAIKQASRLHIPSFVWVSTYDELMHRAREARPR
jgi:hypothetical protein